MPFAGTAQHQLKQSVLGAVLDHLHDLCVRERERYRSDLVCILESEQSIREFLEYPANNRWWRCQSSLVVPLGDQANLPDAFCE